MKHCNINFLNWQSDTQSSVWTLLQCMEWDLSDVQSGLTKGKCSEDHIANTHGYWCTKIISEANWYVSYRLQSLLVWTMKSNGLFFFKNWCITTFDSFCVTFVVIQKNNHFFMQFNWKTDVCIPCISLYHHTIEQDENITLWLLLFFASSLTACKEHPESQHDILNILWSNT